MKDKFLVLWSNHKSAVISATLGIIVSYYFYLVSVKEREPIFFVDKTKAMLVDKYLIKDRPIKILNSRGIEIKDDVTAITLYFFNAGQESIKEENVLSPLTLDLPSDCEILDYKILKASRPVSSIELIRRDTLKNSLEVRFRILEKDDGFSAQIIFQGNDSSVVNVNGAIEGVKEIRSAVPRVFNLKYFLIFFGLFVGCIFVFQMLPKVVDKYKRWYVELGAIVVFISSGFIFFFLVVLAISWLSNEESKYKNSVPIEIRN